MPKFSQVPLSEKPQKQDLDPKVIDEYKKFIKNLDQQSKGLLTYDKNEKNEMQIGKVALIEAAKQLNKYIRVRKKRGDSQTLEFVFITKKEFEDMEKRNKERGKKIAEAKSKK